MPELPFERVARNDPAHGRLPADLRIDVDPREAAPDIRGLVINPGAFRTIDPYSFSYHSSAPFSHGCRRAASKDLLGESPDAARQSLETAGQMLLSSRTELKRCLFDLRHDALGALSFNEALRTTLDPISADAALTIRFNVRRDIFSDTTAHIVLCIVRELVSNAIRHGKARSVRIAGEYHDGTLRFSVRDDGVGFDADRCPGPAEGHFGLEGIRERVRRLKGVFSIESSPGGPTRAVVTADLNPSVQKEVSA